MPNRKKERYYGERLLNKINNKIMKDLLDRVVTKKEQDRIMEEDNKFLDNFYKIFKKKYKVKKVICPSCKGQAHFEWDCMRCKAEGYVYIPPLPGLPGCIYYFTYNPTIDKYVKCKWGDNEKYDINGALKFGTLKL